MPQSRLAPLPLVYKILVAWSVSKDKKGNSRQRVEVEAKDLPPGWPHKGKSWKVDVLWVNLSYAHTASFSSAPSIPVIRIREAPVRSATHSAHHEATHLLQWIAEQAGRPAGYAQQEQEEVPLTSRSAGQATVSLPHSRRPEEFWPNIYSDADTVVDRVAGSSTPYLSARDWIVQQANWRFRGEGYTKKKVRYVGVLLNLVEKRLHDLGLTRAVVGRRDLSGKRKRLPNPRRNPSAATFPIGRQHFGDFTEVVREGESTLREAVAGIARLKEDFLHAAASAAFYKKDLREVKAKLRESEVRAATGERDVQYARSALRDCSGELSQFRREERNLKDCMEQYVEATQERDDLKRQVRQLRINLEEAKRSTSTLTASTQSSSARKRARREKEAVMREQSKKDARKGKRRR